MSQPDGQEDWPAPQLAFAQVNAVTCFSARVLYDTVLNAIAKWKPRWEDGCENWPGSSGSGIRYNDGLDGFMHGLRALRTDLMRKGMEEDASNTRGKGKARSKGKGKAMASDRVEKNVRMVLVVERAERLKESLPELLIPLTRLSELVSIVLHIMILVNDRQLVPSRHNHNFPVRRAMGRLQTTPRRRFGSLPHINPTSH